MQPRTGLKIGVRTIFIVRLSIAHSGFDFIVYGYVMVDEALNETAQAGHIS